MVDKSSGAEDYVLTHVLVNCGVSDFITKQKRPYEEECLQAFLPYFGSGGVFVDAGAHIGNHSVYMMTHSTATVVAFEPNPKAFSALTGNIFDNDLQSRAKIYNLALGDKKAKATLSNTDKNDPGMLSLLPSSSTATGIQTSIYPLDSFANEIGGPIKVLKIDVEGYESKVVSGARTLIAKDKPLICAESRTVEEFDDLLAIMIELGYVPSEIYNATPTIFWLHDEEKAKNITPNALRPFRYAIEAQTQLNQIITETKVSGSKTPSTIDALREHLKSGQHEEPKEQLVPAPDTASVKEVLSKMTGAKKAAQPAVSSKALFDEVRAKLSQSESESAQAKPTPPPAVEATQDYDDAAAKFLSKTSKSKPAVKKQGGSGKDIIERMR